MNTDHEILEGAFQEAWRQSHMSNCLKKKVGAALIWRTKDEVTPGLVPASGRGGAVVPCEKCLRKEVEWSQDGCWSIHAEMATIFQALRVFKDPFDYLKECIMVTTHGPCDQCLKYMHYFGIRAVIYDIPYHNDYSKWEGKIKVYSKEELKGDINLSQL